MYQITDSLLQQIKAENEVHTFEEGQVIVDFYKYIRHIPYILSGNVKVVSEDEQNNEIVLYHLKAGDSCVMSILGAINQTASKVKAITISPTEVVFIKPEKAALWLRKNPDWIDFIFSLYQARFEELLRVATHANLQTNNDRIAHFLEQRASLLKTRTLTLTHQEIAQDLGTSREVVSRILKKMEKQGKLQLLRGKVILR